MDAAMSAANGYPFSQREARGRRPPMITLPCPAIWDGTCSAWGAPGPHGCRLDPHHDGDCECACGQPRAGRPFTEVTA